MPTRVRTILVTGAGGFVGRHLLPALAAAFPDHALLGLSSERLDVTDGHALADVFMREQPDICIHLAGITAIRRTRSNPRRAWEINLHGSLNIAEAILTRAPQCRMIHVSSADCYGASFRAGHPLDETAALAPLNLYAATKAAADLALGARAADGLRLLRLRPCNHTGPGQSEDFVVPAFAAQIARIEADQAPPEIAVGALSPVRDFLDIRDVCAAYVACVACEHALPDNEILNIASGQGISISTLLEMLLALSPRRISIREDVTRLRPVDIAAATGDARRARLSLGWTPQISIATTLRDVLDFARGQTAMPFTAP